MAAWHHKGEAFEKLGRDAEAETAFANAKEHRIWG